MEAQQVYVIRSGCGAIKIGIAVRPDERMAALQVCQPRELEMLYASMPRADARRIEQRCHARFRERRLRGEWFEISADEAVKQVCLLTGEQWPGPMPALDWKVGRLDAALEYAALRRQGLAA